MMVDMEGNEIKLIKVIMKSIIIKLVYTVVISFSIQLIV